MRSILCSVEVDAGIDAVWDAWTTTEGVTSFFAPACNVEMRIDGAYEMFFDPVGDPGQRGGEGVRFLAIEPKTMLSFTWNAPPHLSNVRGQWTYVTVRLVELTPGRTEVTLFHGGWGDGPEWNKAFDYFVYAWEKIVLPRLQYRFSVGPVDWDDPPKPA